MSKRVFIAIRRLIDLVLFGLVAYLALSLLLLGPLVISLLGLAASVGTFVGAACLLLGKMRTGLVLLGIGVGAFVALTVILNQMFSARDAVQSLDSYSYSDSIPISSLSIDFDD